MSKTDAYPPSEFLRDFQEWQAARKYQPDIFRRAQLLFSRRYYPDLKAYRYRVNRFICVLRVIHKQLPQLLQDRIALCGKADLDYIPEHLLLVLHEWYCGVSDSDMAAMPDPDWAAVLLRYDELKSSTQ